MKKENQLGLWEFLERAPDGLEYVHSKFVGTLEEAERMAFPRGFAVRFVARVTIRGSKFLQALLEAN